MNDEAIAICTPYPAPQVMLERPLVDEIGIRQDDSCNFPSADKPFSMVCDCDNLAPLLVVELPLIWAP